MLLFYIIQSAKPRSTTERDKLKSQNGLEDSNKRGIFELRFKYRKLCESFRFFY